jgi:hypothetical protein
MAQAAPREMAKQRVLYTLPQMSDVIVRRDQECARCDAPALAMDLYYPPGAAPGAPVPAVLFVTGFADRGAERIFGCRLKDMGSFLSWAQLAAASGMAAVTYVNNDPTGDAVRMFRCLKDHGADFGIDANRLGLWTCSGHAPTALSLLMQHPRDIRCGVYCYPYLLDLDGDGAVARAAAQFGFANAAAGKAVEDLPRDVPLLIVRAGQDQMPGLNGAIDRFIGKALPLNLPITFVNHAAAPHAFDLSFDSHMSREIIAATLQFMRGVLTAA